MYLRRSVTFLALSLTVAATLVPIAIAQTPPTFNSPAQLLWSEIRYTIGEDPFVSLDPLNESTNPIVITIHANDPSGQNAQAKELASIVIPHFDFGITPVNIRVVDIGGNVVSATEPASPDDVVNAFAEALLTNRLFVGSYVSHAQAPYGVGAIFARDVVQFFSGDQGEPYGNTNEAAATVFKRLLRTNFPTNNVPVYFGTLPRRALPQLLPSAATTTRSARK
jgi:hypothetical protein